MDLIIGIVTLIISVFFIRVFSLFLHELGHAIPALIFTKKTVSIYIGSYGSKENSFKINFKSLTIYIFKSPLHLVGLCSHNHNNLTVFKNIVILLMGPLASFFVATLFAFFIFVYDLHGSLKTISFLFIISAWFDLVMNLNPSSTPIQLNNGGITYNDGYQIKQQAKLLFKKKEFREKYTRLYSLLNNDGEVNFLNYYDKYVSEGFKSLEMLEHAVQVAINQGKYKQAKQYLKTLESLKKFTANDFLLQTYSEYYLGNFEEARKYCEKALKLSPNNARAITIQIDWYFEEGNRDKTDELLKRLEPLKKKGFNEYYILGRIYLNYGEVEKAISSFEEIQKKYEGDEATLIFLCAAYAYNNNSREAIKILELFEKKEDCSINHLVNLAFMSVELKEYKKGIQYLLRALEIDHTEVQALNNMSYSLNFLARYDEAIAYANKGISISPKKYSLYTNKAYAELMLGKLEEGKTTNETGLSLNLNSSYGYRNLGLYYKEIGALQEAKKHLQKSIELDKTTHHTKPLLFEVEELINN